MPQIEMTLIIDIPDEPKLLDREIVTAMESGLASAVLRAYEESLPVDHVAWTKKYRSLSDEQKIELQRERKRLRRATAVTRVIEELPNAPD